MSLESQIMEQIKIAMKSKNRIALDALRAVKSELLLNKTNGKDEKLSESDEIAILQKQIKQRKDSAQQFSEQDRQEMADTELAQAEVIQQFLPEQLSETDIQSIVETIIAETAASGMKDMGKVMGLANQKMAGKADGKSISNSVKKLLN